MPRPRTHIVVITAAMAVLASCSMTGAPDDRGIADSATSVVDGALRETAALRVDSSGIRTLVATITFENLMGAPAALEWGEDCALNGPVAVLVHREGNLVWDSRRYGPFLGCPTSLIRSSIDAHGSAAFAYQVAVGSILGDSLPAGSYELSLRSLFASPVATREVPAGELTLGDPVAVSPSVNLDGEWGGSAGGLTVSLKLTWTADSVRGAGTYTTTTPADSRCAVPSLHTSGAVTWAARRVGDVVSGALSFDVGYDPPYGGRLRSATRFDGATMGVDTPGCSLTLNRV